LNTFLSLAQPILTVSVSTVQRIALVTVVLLAHLGVYILSAMREPAALLLPHEMSVSMVTPRSAAAPPVSTPTPNRYIAAAKSPPPKTLPLAKAVAHPLVEPSPLASTVVPDKVAAAPGPALANAPVVPDREPDYQAGYLHNPRPVYPLAAQRMGWQGKVILRVEVLASGTAGEVTIYQSSGRESLDNAALAAVKNWRFTPARVDGEFITKTFLVPIPFKLESDSE
jgi:periplasmic protein TonB